MPKSENKGTYLESQEPRGLNIEEIVNINVRIQYSGAICKLVH